MKHDEQCEIAHPYVDEDTGAVVPRNYCGCGTRAVRRDREAMADDSWWPILP